MCFIYLLNRFTLIKPYRKEMILEAYLLILEAFILILEAFVLVDLLPVQI